MTPEIPPKKTTETDIGMPTYVTIPCIDINHLIEDSVNKLQFLSDRKSVFDRYYRITSQERNTESGLGLGLYISAESLKDTVVPWV